jgi:UTP--glucose-1-phosphate uridylyltransferase
VPDGLELALAKMRAAGVNPTALSIFAHYYAELAAGSTGLIPESAIEPLDSPEQVDDLTERPGDRQALGQTVIIRLNGGLGTSMGLDRAKTLLPVRDGLTFLDLIVRQVQYARQAYQVELPLLFLHSFNTRADCLEALAAYPDLPVGDLPLDMVQSQEPKLLRSNLQPVEWPANRRLEWCPPGHGDLYPTLLDSGLLDQLLAAGLRYASVSNSDNLGCAPSPALAGWFARSGAPFAAEITLRTDMDLKGGHLARRRSDGRLILRESAQTPAQDMVHFTDAAVHPYTHCNNLWFDLAALRAKLERTGGVLRLPLIRNAKTVDPGDPDSPAVYQIESAMGAAIEVFEGAAAVAVARRRFLPVKTTNELALLRSDVFDLGPDSIPRARTTDLPVLSLDKTYYGRLADFEARLPAPLSLADSACLEVVGDWRFGAGVRVSGRVRLSGGGTVPDGAHLEGD